jgi:hypothetical protein
MMKWKYQIKIKSSYISSKVFMMLTSKKLDEMPKNNKNKNCLDSYKTCLIGIAVSWSCGNNLWALKGS